MEKSTKKFYSFFEFLHSYFNKYLFNDILPNSIIVISRKPKSFGYFYPSRWENEKGQQLDEIALNPAYFDRLPMIEILQTMAHEMCHQWQHHFGETSPQRNYHNKEFAHKMIEIGLMPTDTGKEGGNIVGQSILEYPIKKGKFIKTCNKLTQHKKFNLTFYDRIIQEKELMALKDLEEEKTELKDLNINPLLLEKPLIREKMIIKTPVSSSGKYVCETCQTILRGKKGLSIICGTCNNPYVYIKS